MFFRQIIKSSHVMLSQLPAKSFQFFWGVLVRFPPRSQPKFCVRNLHFHLGVDLKPIEERFHPLTPKSSIRIAVYLNHREITYILPSPSQLNRYFHAREHIPTFLSAWEGCHSLSQPGQPSCNPNSLQPSLNEIWKRSNHPKFSKVLKSLEGWIL